MHPDAFKTFSEILWRPCSEAFLQQLLIRVDCHRGRMAMPSWCLCASYSMVRCLVLTQFSLEDLESVNTPLCRAWDLAVSCSELVSARLALTYWVFETQHSLRECHHPSWAENWTQIVCAVKDVECTVYLNTAVGQSTTAHVIFVYIMFDNILLICFPSFYW